MAELISAIAGAVLGTAGFVFGVVKWREAKREKAEAKRKQTTEEVISKKIDAAILPLRQTNAEQNERIARLEKKQDENERDRLRAEIMIMANKLHNGQHIRDVEFKHIEGVYTKYKKLGGNSYIDLQMEYIRDEERKCVHTPDDRNN